MYDMMMMMIKKMIKMMTFPPERTLVLTCWRSTFSAVAIMGFPRTTPLEKGDDDDDDDNDGEHVYDNDDYDEADHDYDEDILGDQHTVYNSFRRR